MNLSNLFIIDGEVKNCHNMVGKSGKPYTTLVVTKIANCKDPESSIEMTIFSNPKYEIGDRVRVTGRIDSNYYEKTNRWFTKLIADTVSTVKDSKSNYAPKEKYAPEAQQSKQLDMIDKEYELKVDPGFTTSDIPF